MRIVMFSRFPSDVNHPKGGVESATVGLVRGLAAQPGLELHVVTLERRLSHTVVEELPFATIHRLPGNRRPMILDVFGGPGRRRIDDYIVGLKPDIVHFQESYGLGGPYSDIPTVFTVHGFDSLNLVTERKYAWWLRAPLWKIAEKKGLRKHANIISIAPYVTEKLKAESTAEITEIPNAISPEFFTVESKPVPGRIFFAGWINSRKNVMAAIRATNKLLQQGMDVSLHIAGDVADQDYADKVTQLVAYLGLESSVLMLGRIGHKELRQELTEASVFVLPSLQENAPMAIAEAMAAGVPVVTSNVCGMPTMVAEGKAGFLIGPNDIGSIAEKLAVILQDSSRRDEMSKFVRNQAQQTYHPDSVVSATLALYKRIIDGQNRG
ncbi:MAG: glycosyltransferase family 4 protein [Gammaproteobacteria bacterium]|nr:glycosyltransferase family 4 protein [Gammaproteobacteria bacterium]